MKKVLWFGLIGGFLLILGMYGYNRIFASSLIEEQTIKKDSASALNVDINIGVGDLYISGGADDWMEGTFDYTAKRYAPDISYKKKNDTGILKIKQQPLMTMGFFKNKMKSDWDIQLSDDVPIDLNVDMGVSDTSLDLKGLQLNNLKIDSGVSDSTIDLSGDWPKSFQTKIAMGVGDVTLLLPKQTGVKLSVSKGIGTVSMDGFISQGNRIYVNEAYDSSDVVLDIQLDIGVGDVKIKLID